MDIDVHEKKIFTSFDRWNAGERERASDAGEMRQEVGELVELTGISKKALSWVRSLDKMEEDKRNDVIRSLKPLLDLFEKRWDAEGTPDFLDGADEAIEPMEEGDDGVEVEFESSTEDGDPEVAEEASEFADALAELADEDEEPSNVQQLRTAAG